MSLHGIEAMDRRLDRLERANHDLGRTCRRWRFAAAGAWTGLAVILITGAAARTPDAVEAGQFVLRDDEGAMRAALALRPDGTPGLALFDQRGRLRLSLDLDEVGRPGVDLHGEDGTLQAALATRPDGTPGLGLFREGKPRLSLDLGTGGGPGVHLYQDDGTLRAALAIRPDGTPGLGLFDARGQVQQSIDVPADEDSPPDVGLGSVRDLGPLACAGRASPSVGLPSRPTHPSSPSRDGAGIR